MKAIYQEIFCDRRGDCLKATIASLLEVPLADVPHFVEQEDWFGCLSDFMEKHGYEYSNYVVNPNRKDLGGGGLDGYEHFRESLGEGGHIGGFYEATVYSPGRYTKENPVCHAVIIDKDFNIVHDPNPNYKGVKYPEADTLGYNGILGVTRWIKKQVTPEP